MDLVMKKEIALKRIMPVSLLILLMGVLIGSYKPGNGRRCLKNRFFIDKRRKIFYYSYIIVNIYIYYAEKGGTFYEEKDYGKADPSGGPVYLVDGRSDPFLREKVGKSDFDGGTACGGAGTQPTDIR
jgi:hypothetical protein